MILIGIWYSLENLESSHHYLNCCFVIVVKLACQHYVLTSPQCWFTWCKL